MNRTLLSLLSLCVGLGLYAQEVTPVDHVNVMMGTASEYALSQGNTYPIIAMPWGMNFWTPVTNNMGDGWQYQYSAKKIKGFKQTHQPSPWINDYGQFALMPTTDKVTVDQDERASWYSHKSEKATPYYYSVYLADYDVMTEMTPTERAALFRFAYPKGRSAHLVIDAFDKGSYIKVIPSQRKVIGYSTKNSGGVPDNFRNYFVLEFDQPFEVGQLWSDSVVLANTLEAESDHVATVLNFPEGVKVHARVASSFISHEQAAQNLKELGTQTVEQLSQRGKDEWDKLLGRVTLGKDENLDDTRTFYSTLYRSLLFPRRFYEVTAEGKTVHYSPYNGKVLPGYMYTDTGFWDTFRSLFPLLNLIYPDEAVKMQEGLVNAYLESGFLPEWASPGHRGCMVGNNSASIVADAYIKGLRGYDAETLWKAVTHGASAVHPDVSSTGRLGHEYYNELGYVPYNVGINESAARTLEYAYDDWCIYQFGKALGKSEKELSQYKKNAMNYSHLFDPEHKLMRGKNADGTFQSPFNPLKWGDAFTEGNSWHYTWSVFHDPAGLIKLMGGQDGFNAMMDSVFSVPPLFDDSYYGQVIHEIREMQVMNMGNYAHGNQPIQHMIYLYNYSGQPWKAQYWIREVMSRLYTPTPDGYCGDEDNGQTSAWYVFSALGFYPVCPGSDQYILGAPLFKDATIHFPSGKHLKLNAPNNSKGNRYIDAVEWGGRPMTQNYFTHDQLTDGGIIRFRMTDKPNLRRGTESKAYPYSFSK